MFYFGLFSTIMYRNHVIKYTPFVIIHTSIYGHCTFDLIHLERYLFVDLSCF